MKNLQKLTIALVLLFSVSFFAQNHNLQDLVGTAGSNTEYLLSQKGYKHINTRKNNNDVYANWWNSKEQKCITTHLTNGKIQSVKGVPAFDCNKGSNSSNLQDLVGTKGSSAEYELQKNGYVHINSRKSNNDIYANWWNEREKKCVSTHLSNGSIKSIKKVPAFDCNKSSNGASLHHYSTGHSLQSLVGVKGSSAESELTNKGYAHINTRKYNNDIYANWWNAREQKCVTTHLSDGRIQSIKEAPAFDCEKKTNDGNWDNNSSHVNVTDLMKVSAPLAYDQLKERGFRFVKGGGKYKVWYNKNTNQCIKTVSIQEHIHDIIKSTQCK